MVHPHTFFYFILLHLTLRGVHSQTRVLIDMDTDIPDTGAWEFLDCGYADLSTDYKCNGLEIEIPPNDRNGEKGFWSSCEYRCYIKYNVQLGDIIFKARVYQRNNVLTEVSYDGINWDYLEGAGWVEFTHVLESSGKKEISLRFDIFGADTFSALDKIVLNGEFDPPPDPTTEPSSTTDAETSSITSESSTEITDTTTEDPSSTTTEDPSSTTTEDPSSTTTEDPFSTTTGDETSTTTTDDNLSSTSESSESTTFSSTTTDDDENSSSPVSDSSSSELPTSYSTTDATTETDAISSESDITTLSSTTDMEASTTDVNSTPNTTDNDGVSTTDTDSTDSTTVPSTTDEGGDGSTETESTSTTETEFTSTTEIGPTSTTDIITDDTPTNSEPGKTPTSPISPVDPPSTSSTAPPTTTKKSPGSGFFNGVWGALLLSLLGIGLFLIIFFICCLRCFYVRGASLRRRRKRDDTEDIISQTDSNSSRKENAVKDRELYTYMNRYPYLMEPDLSRRPPVAPPSSKSSSSTNHPFYPRAIYRESTPYKAFEQSFRQSDVGTQSPPLSLSRDVIYAQNDHVTNAGSIQVLPRYPLQRTTPSVIPSKPYPEISLQAGHYHREMPNEHNEQNNRSTWVVP